MKKGTKLYSILYQKCPRCHEGDLFEDRNPYHLKRIFNMPNTCSKCGQLYNLEPSFYYGAMYVNYGLTVAFGVAVFVAMSVLGGRFLEAEYYLSGIILTLIICAPFTFRLGRAIWINMFVKYNPHALTAYQELEEKKAEA